MVVRPLAAPTHLCQSKRVWRGRWFIVGPFLTRPRLWHPPPGVPESVIDSGRTSRRLRWRTNFSPGDLAFSSSERLREVYVQAAAVESATVVMD